MIMRDRNRACVVIWSLGNEISKDPNGYGPRMKALVQSLDSDSADHRRRKPRPACVEDVLDTHYSEPSNSSASQKACTESETYPGEIYDDWKNVEDNSWFAGQHGVDGVGLHRRGRDRCTAAIAGRGRPRRDGLWGWELSTSGLPPIRGTCPTAAMST